MSIVDTNFEKNQKENNFVIQATNLTFKYGANEVLQNLNFSILAGEYVGLIGPNGGGKTTLTKLILGLLKPSTGQIQLFGQPLSKLGKDWSKIGYVPQKSSQIGIDFPATVDEVLNTVLKSEITNNKSTHEILELNEILTILDIEKLRNRLLRELSGGERQKVFLARALLKNPELIILDEPTVGVDAASEAKFYRALEHLNQSHKMAILLVSHDITAVANSVQKVLFLKNKLTVHENPEKFLQNETLQELYGNDSQLIHQLNE